MRLRAWRLKRGGFDGEPGRARRRHPPLAPCEISQAGLQRSVVAAAVAAAGASRSHFMLGSMSELSLAARCTYRAAVACTVRARGANSSDQSGAHRRWQVLQTKHAQPSVAAGRQPLGAESATLQRVTSEVRSVDARDRTTARGEGAWMCAGRVQPQEPIVMGRWPRARALQSQARRSSQRTGSGEGSACSSRAP